VTQPYLSRYRRLLHAKAVSAAPAASFKSLVHQTLQWFDGHELEIMERLSLSPDRTKLSCLLELSSGGHTVNYTEEFPITNAEM
jgi:hypothetical protein